MSLDEKTRKDVRNVATGGFLGGVFGNGVENTIRSDRKKLVYVGVGAVLGGIAEHLYSKGVFKKASDYVAEKANALRKKDNDYQAGPDDS